MIEDEKTEWKNIDEMLSLVNSKQYVKTEYMGKYITVAWKELSDEEYMQYLNPEIEKLPEPEKDREMRKLMEKLTLSMIRKAGRDEKCINNNEITDEDWNKMPLRIRANIMVNMFSVRNKIMNDFLFQ